ncbi:hypothetical protein ACTXT7_001788 [Hymenolepis weldensis]
MDRHRIDNWTKGERGHHLEGVKCPQKPALPLILIDRKRRTREDEQSYPPSDVPLYAHLALTPNSDTRNNAYRTTPSVSLLKSVNCLGYLITVITFDEEWHEICLRYHLERKITESIRKNDGNV